MGHDDDSFYWDALGWAVWCVLFAVFLMLPL